MNEWWAAGAGCAIGAVATVAVTTAFSEMRQRSRPAFVAPAPPPHPVAQPQTWEFLNEEARLLLDAQRSAGERIETKAALVIGAALTLAQFVATQSRTSYWLPVALGSFGASIVSGLVSVRPRTFDNVGLHQVIHGVWWLERGFAAAELVNNRDEAVRANARRHQARVTWFWLSLAALGTGAIMSTIHLTIGDRTDDDDRLNGTCVTTDDPRIFACSSDP